MSGRLTYLLYSRMRVATKPPIFWLTCTHALQAPHASHSWIFPMFFCINQSGSWLHPHQALGSFRSAKSFAICLTALWPPKFYCYFLFTVIYRFIPFFSDISLDRNTGSKDKWIWSMSFQIRNLKSLLSSKHHLKLFLSQSIFYLHPIYIICSLWSVEKCFSSGVRRDGDIKRKKKAI